MYSHSSRFTVISCWIGTSSLGTPAGMKQCTDRLIQRVTKDGHYFLMSYINTCTYTVRIMYTYTHVVEICACNTAHACQISKHASKNDRVLPATVR